MKRKLTKKTILLISIFIFALFFTSCVSIPEERRACYNVPPEDSKLCAWLGDIWEETNVVMRISNAALIQEGVYSAEQALNVVNELDKSLDSPGGAIYSVFFKLVAEKAGPLVAITINESISELYDITDPITPFDISLLKNELAKHRLNIELFISMEKNKET